MYRFVTLESFTPHSNHMWEEWHAYVNDLTDAPDFVTGDSAGICCHTCQLVIID